MGLFDTFKKTSETNDGQNIATIPTQEETVNIVNQDSNIGGGNINRESSEVNEIDKVAKEISAKPADVSNIDENNMTLDEFEALFCSREIPSKWNVYKWCKEHGDKAIAQAFFRVRRIMNRADFIQINISGGKDSTLSFEIASLELRYRKALIKAINEGNIIDSDKYQYVDIVYDESQNRNDYDVFEKTNEVYESFENINLNVPMIYLNSQDAELIFSDAINHIQYDVNLVHGYGLYKFAGKIVCGHDIIPKKIREHYQKEGIEIYADLWQHLEEVAPVMIKDLTVEDLLKEGVDEKLVKIIESGRFPYAAKYIGPQTEIPGYGKLDFTCIVKGDQSGHMFYKCLSISYQDGSSYGSGRFVAWDKTKESIWCREMPTRETHGLDILTNYNMCEANYLPVSKIKPELVELHKDQIKNIDGVDCIPNWGFGANSLCDYDKTFEKMFGSLMLKKKDVYPELNGTDKGEEYAELWTYVSQSDEDAGGSETDTFARWVLGSVPDFITIEFVPGKPRTHATQIYSLVSIRAAESFDRYTILKQSEYFTGQYASKEAR